MCCGKAIGSLWPFGQIRSSCLPVQVRVPAHLAQQLHACDRRPRAERRRRAGLGVRVGCRSRLYRGKAVEIGSFSVALLKLMSLRPLRMRAARRAAADNRSPRENPSGAVENLSFAASSYPAHLSPMSLAPSRPARFSLSMAEIANLIPRNATDKGARNATERSSASEADENPRPRASDLGRA
jgi:hypothetical protein